MLAEVVVPVNGSPTEVAHLSAAAAGHAVATLRFNQASPTLVAFSNAGSCHFLFSATQEEGEELEMGRLHSPACSEVTAAPSQHGFNPLSPFSLLLRYPHSPPLFQGGLGSAPLGASPGQLKNKLSEGKSITYCMLRPRFWFPCEPKHSGARLWLGRNLNRKSRDQRACGFLTLPQRNMVQEIKFRKSKLFAVICSIVLCLAVALVTKSP